MLNLSESSFSVNKESPNLFVLFRVKFLTLAWNAPADPLLNALTSVEKLLYPIPLLITIASVTLLFSITGRITAPAPTPESVTLSSGIELYSLPLFVTAQSIILPLTMIGLNSESLPSSMVILGVISVSNISEP